VSILFFCLAAFFEIAGCFTFWMWLRNGRSPAFAVIGVLSLILFAFALTRVDAAFAGRAFAAYGGIYIAASLSGFGLSKVFDRIGGTSPVERCPLPARL
jgi:small multidrug resistance family-3 protein